MLRLLVVMLLLVPAAEACSFSREPPAPGVFYVWDMQGEPLAVAVPKRGLGAGCELSNHHAVDGSRFAWIEGSTMHVIGLDDRNREQVAWSGDHPQDISLADGAILVHENKGSGADRQHQVWQVDGSGAKTLLYSTSAFGELHGGYYVTPDVEIVDVRTGRTVAQAMTPEQRGYSGDPLHFIGTDGRFLVYEEVHSGGDTYHIHDLEQESWRTVREEPYRHAEQVADGFLFAVREGNLTRIELATGDRTEAQVPNVQLVGAGGGHAVFGAYSADSVAGPWRAAFAEAAVPVPLWPLLLALVLVRKLRD